MDNFNEPQINPETGEVIGDDSLDDNNDDDRGKNNRRGHARNQLKREASAGGKTARASEGIEAAKAAANIAKTAGTVGRGVATASEAVGVWAAITGALAGLSAPVIMTIIIVGILALVLGSTIFFGCDQIPLVCGGSEKTTPSGDELSLQAQLEALTTGVLKPEEILRIVNQVEIKLKQQVASAKENKNKHLTEINDLANQGFAIINKIKSQLANAPATTKPSSYLPSPISLIPPKVLAVTPPVALTVPQTTQTQVRQELKDLSEILSKLQTYDVVVIFGATALPINSSAITGYNNTLHRRSINRQFNPSDDKGHRVFLGYGDDKNGCDSGICKGDAVDLLAPAKTLVYAPVSGKVTVSNRGSRFENVQVKSSAQRVTGLLAHIRATVSSGQSVNAGDQVGVVGDYPKWTPHLHFELWVNGQSIHHDLGTPFKTSGKILWQKMQIALKGAA